MPVEKSDKLDVGATDISKVAEVRLVVADSGRKYCISIAPNNVIKIFEMHAKLDGPGYDLGEIPNLNLSFCREILGYVLRRAICRGIDTSEIRETMHRDNKPGEYDRELVEINMGTLHLGKF